MQTTHNIPNTSVTIYLTPQSQYTQHHNHNIPKQSEQKEGVWLFAIFASI